MERCQSQRGFLALRRCDEDAVGTCADCSRTVCASHLVGRRCTDCAGATADWRTDPQGPSRFRRRFHEEGGWLDRDTVYWGSGPHGFSDPHGVDETTGEGSGWDS